MLFRLWFLFSLNVPAWLIVIVFGFKPFLFNLWQRYFTIDSQYFDIIIPFVTFSRWLSLIILNILIQIPIHVLHHDMIIIRFLHNLVIIYWQTI